MRKEKADLEQLLNSLIEKGWEPFGSHKDNIRRYKYDNRFFDFNHEGDNMVSIRELVSKESGLWQFVCENHLYIYKMGENKNFIQDHFKNEYNECCYQYLYDKSCYEYYLLESSLKDESELEDFLLSNIRI